MAPFFVWGPGAEGGAAVRPGAADGTRTRKPGKAADFKSAESTNFSTAARQARYCGGSASRMQARKSDATVTAGNNVDLAVAPGKFRSPTIRSKRNLTLRGGYETLVARSIRCRSRACVRGSNGPCERRRGNWGPGRGGWRAGLLSAGSGLLCTAACRGGACAGLLRPAPGGGTSASGLLRSWLLRPAALLRRPPRLLWSAGILSWPWSWSWPLARRLIVFDLRKLFEREGALRGPFSFLPHCDMRR